MQKILEMPEIFCLILTKNLPGFSPKKRVFGQTLSRKTIKKRFKRKCKEVTEELRKRMHHKIKQTGEWLAQVINGHMNYYGVPGNMDRIRDFQQRCEREWYKVVRRRSQKAQKLKWKEFRKKIKGLIPRPHLTHPFPGERFWRHRLEVRAG
jgi:RNA-directed DNA polymerase